MTELSRPSNKYLFAIYYSRSLLYAQSMIQYTMTTQIISSPSLEV